MIDLIRRQQQQASQLQVVQNVESPDAYLSVRRTAIVALTANAWTNITWQAQIRAQQITWSGTTITLPNSGYYHYSLAYATSGTTNSVVGLIVNGTIQLNLQPMTATTIPTSVYMASGMRYFDASDTVLVRIYSTNAVNLNATAEKSSFESPIFHILQLTRGAV